jgi:hypothetical protein
MPIRQVAISLLLLGCCLRGANFGESGFSAKSALMEYSEIRLRHESYSPLYES